MKKISINHYASTTRNHPACHDSICCVMEMNPYFHFRDTSKTVNTSDRFKKINTIAKKMNYLERSNAEEFGRYKKTWQIMLAGDSIVLGSPINLYQNIWDFACIMSQKIYDLIQFQFDFLESGELLRGRIERCDLILQNRIVYGDGYSKAVSSLYQSKGVDLPMVVLSRSMVNFIYELQRHYGANLIHSPFSRYIIKDQLGNLFLNFLIPLAEDAKGVQTEDQNNTLLNLKYQIEKKISEISKDDLYSLRIFNWYADYFNYFCKTFLGITNVNRLIDKNETNQFSLIFGERVSGKERLK